MIAFLISLIVFLLVASVLLFITRALLALLPPPLSKFHNVIYGLVVLILLLLFLSEVGVLGAPHAWRMWR